MNNQTQIIDTHAHYDHKQFNPDRAELLTQMAADSIANIINVGCDLKSSKASATLAEAYPFIFSTVGVHPHYASSLSEQNLKLLETLCAHKKVVAYGEIGLDFFHNFSPQDTQRYWFKRQLELAEMLNMPVVIHSRDAAEETFETIEKSAIRKGVIHSFSGDMALARAYISLGFHIGIGGVLTFDKTKRLPDVVDAISLDKILLETDAPYLTPTPFRGKRNNSSYLTYVASAIAEIKRVAYEHVCAQTTINACDLFGI